MIHPIGGKADPQTAQLKRHGSFIPIAIIETIKHQLVDKHSLSVMRIIATAMLPLSQHVIAADWLISPRLNLQETYSDNVRLAPPNLSRSDWITQIDPGISLSKESPRLYLNANYKLQNFLYKEDKKSQKSHHVLNTDANAKLIDEMLFLDIKATVSQQSISAQGPQAADNSNLTNNRATVGTYTTSPFLRHRFGAVATSELRYTQDEVRTRVVGLSNSKGRGTLFNISSDPAFSRLGWSLHYSTKKTDYSNHPTIHNEAILSNLRFPVTPKFDLSASVGREKNNYISTGPKPEGSTTTVGFAWAPTERTKIEYNAGHRYFGKTYTIKASHRTGKTYWNLAINKDITTSQSQFLIPATISTSTFLSNLYSAKFPDDPAALQQYVDYVISSNNLPTSLANPVNYLSNRVFLQKNIQASVAITGTRNSIILNIFGMSRHAQTSATMDSVLLGSNNLTSNDTSKQVGGNLLWNHQLSTLTSANVSAYASATGRKDFTKSLKVNISKQLEPKLSGMIELRRTQQHTSQLQDNGYQENALTASLSMKF